MVNDESDREGRVALLLSQPKTKNKTIQVVKFRTPSLILDERRNPSCELHVAVAPVANRTKMHTAAYCPDSGEPIPNYSVLATAQHEASLR